MVFVQVALSSQLCVPSVHSLISYKWNRVDFIIISINMKKGQIGGHISLEFTHREEYWCYSIKKSNHTYLALNYWLNELIDINDFQKLKNIKTWILFNLFVFLFFFKISNGGFIFPFSKLPPNFETNSDAMK